MEKNLKKKRNPTSRKVVLTNTCFLLKKSCFVYLWIFSKEKHLMKLDKLVPNYAPPAKDTPGSTFVKETKRRKRKMEATASKAKKKQKRNSKRYIFLF